ncbi:MAG: hypothetical protein R3F55_18900 [Alphaproteobacteria bacterium]
MRKYARLVAAVGALLGLVATQAPAQALDAADVFTDSYAVAHVDFTPVDAARSDRPVPFQVYYPQGFSGEASVILVSHGGAGAATGFGYMQFYGEYLARGGFVVVVVAHRPSASDRRHAPDTPLDVSFVLDTLESGGAPLPADFGGSLNLRAVGHIGHSFGAYTGHAVAGADLTHGDYRDPRIAAIAPISPQGGDYGQYDNGPADNSWSGIAIPSYILVGGREINGHNDGPLWRTVPFQRYPADGNRFLTVIQGQNHGQMGGDGAPDVKAFLLANIALFFDIYLRGADHDPCLIGSLNLPQATTITTRKMPGGPVDIALTCAP